MEHDKNICMMTFNKRHFFGSKNNKSKDETKQQEEEEKETGEKETQKEKTEEKKKDATSSDISSSEAEEEGLSSDDIKKIKALIKEQDETIEKH